MRRQQPCSSQAQREGSARTLRSRLQKLASRTMTWPLITDRSTLPMLGAHRTRAATGSCAAPAHHQHQHAGACHSVSSLGDRMLVLAGTVLPAPASAGGTDLRAVDPTTHRQSPSAATVPPASWAAP